MLSRSLRVLNCGRHLVKYADGLAAQEALAEQVKMGKEPGQDTILLLQHHPVYTIGKRGRAEDFRAPTEDLIASGADIHHAPRGGEVTFHGPGQLVAYPIMQLREAGLGARRFVETLEDSIISVVGDFGIKAHGRLKGATGVWVEDRKIAAIGVKISHGISSHGLALNIATDLNYFKHIIPCGIPNKEVTSMELEMQRQNPRGSSRGTASDCRHGEEDQKQPSTAFEDVTKIFVNHFARCFHYQEGKVFEEVVGASKLMEHVFPRA